MRAVRTKPVGKRKATSIEGSILKAEAPKESLNKTITGVMDGEAAVTLRHWCDKKWSEAFA